LHFIVLTVLCEKGAIEKEFLGIFREKALLINNKSQIAKNKHNTKKVLEKTLQFDIWRHFETLHDV